MVLRVAVIAVVIVTAANWQVVVGPPVSSDNPVAGIVKNYVWSMVSNALENSPLLNTLYENMKNFPELLYSSNYKFVSRIESTGNALIGECDGPALVKIIEPKLELSLISESECLNGLVIYNAGTPSTKVTMNPGHLVFDITKFKIEGSSGGRGVYLGNFKQLMISFKFKDLEFVYEFISNYGSPKRNRKGYSTFKLKGTSSLNLIVQVPTRVAQVKHLAKEDTCFVNVKRINVELADKIEIIDFVYDSILQTHFKRGVAESFLRKIFNDPVTKKGLRRSVKKTLRNIIDPVISDEKVFCYPEKPTAAEAPECTDKDITQLRTNVPVQ